MSTHLRRFCQLPTTWVERWSLRSGLLLLAVTTLFALVSDDSTISFQVISGLLIGAGLARICRDRAIEVDAGLSRHRGYRLARVLVLGLLRLSWKIILFFWFMMLYSTGARTGNTGMHTMPSGSVDAIWESQPEHYYDSSPPGFGNKR